MATKLNVCIRTLLSNCEELAKDEVNYWRLKKFIKSLDTMIEELDGMNDPHSAEKIPNYCQRLQELKKITNYVDTTPMVDRNRTTRPTDAAIESGKEALKEMNQLQTSKQNSDLRRELLDEDSLRKRKPAKGDSGEQSQAVKYIRDNQEKITEHMLSLTRNLKEQTETANKIIKKDTETMSRSSGMTDRNINALHKETEKLEDHSRKAWRCWMWLMIVFVIVTFIVMVLFMKIVKKRKN